MSQRVAGRGSYTEYEQHSSAAQAFYMGPSIGSGDDLPAVPNAAIDLMASDAEVWREPSRTVSYFSRLANARTHDFLDSWR